MIKYICFVLFVILASSSLIAQGSKSGASYKITGKIYEKSSDGKIPLQAATVAIPDYAVGTVTDKDGLFVLTNIPSGKVKMTVRYLGMVTIEETIDVNKDLDLSYVMQPENFKLVTVTVVAENTNAQQSTASKVSRNAIDHIQATSLQDIMSLLPGGISSNPGLNYNKQITIRNIYTDNNNNEAALTNSTVSNLNAFGTAIISDGAPISNNANMQTMHPSVIGGTTSLSGGSEPSGGVDTRMLSTDNIESVEVIRGIPSVRYGDILSGAVIVNSKASAMPLQVRAKVNPRVYEVSASSGYNLGKRKGALNVSGDYTLNTNDITESYKTYQRGNLKFIYTNRWFDKWTSNTSLNLFYGADRTKKNPDDLVYQRQRKGDNAGVTFNTNGIILLRKPWITNVRYVLSSSYTYKKSYYSEAYSAANYVYSQTTTDGTILSNKPGVDVWDSNGNKITNFSPDQSFLYAREIPSAYIGSYNIEGKEVNVFSSLMGNLYKRIGNTNHAITLGGEFKTDGNEGKGKTFEPDSPPYRNLSAANASFRPRSYKDIPYVNQVGFFVEESFRYNLENRELRITGGLRYDNFSVVKDVFSPRVNASFDIIPNKLKIRGGYGVLAKAPSVLFLYPEKAYFEYVNINELSSTTVADADKLLITTTRVFDTQNKKLKIAKTKKAEIGFDLNLANKVKLYVTAFNERLQDGYTMDLSSESFKPLTYNEYSRVGNDIVLTASSPVLAKYYTPTNDLQNRVNGVEFDAEVTRINAIRTSFSASGLWARNESYSSNYVYYDGRSGTSGSSRTHIGLYESEKNNGQRFSTTLRATHNIPEIGFVITLTWQGIWNEKQWYDIGNVTYPVKYISKYDGLVYDFDPSKASEPEFAAIVDNPYSESQYIKEKYPVSHTFNIHVTKELGDYMRISFFANNLFRNYPTVRSSRYQNTTLQRKQPIFFGLELSLKL